MLSIEHNIQQLRFNAKIIRSVVEPISEEQGQWQPDSDTWSVKKVMEHVYNEERLDFRKHLKEMFSDPPQPWETPRSEDYIAVESCRQALESFLMERESSLEWLGGLESPDWDVISQVSFEPSDEVFSLSAGDVMVSWVAHDFLHIRQMNELLYAWNKEQALPYSVQYAGGW